MLICILTKNVITSCSVTMMLFLHLEVKPLMTLTTVLYSNHETNINIIARRTGKDVNSHTVLDGIITTIMATIQRINIIGSREGSRNRRRLKANQTGKKFRV